MKLNLLEILDTRVQVTWSVNEHQHLGTFKLNDHEYVILIEEFETMTKKSLIEFGFSTDGKLGAVNSGKSSSSIIGAVLNGALPVLKKIDPDIMICIEKTSGLIESRKSLYSTLIKWMGRHLGNYLYVPEWKENKYRFFKLIAKEPLTAEEMEKFTELVRSKDL